MLLTRLDLRELAPPEPMQRILASLETLPRGGRLVAFTPFRPLPLMSLLDAWGYAYRVHDLPAGDACIAICHGDDHAALDPPRVA
ncbi:DUF2249 domain-containing protein [Pseudoxanthomonas beigongshangi]|jgi:uncharacterized protein (DUF2249 family)